VTPDLSQALARLPHGPEFRFVDRLIELVPGERGTGEYRVRGDEAFLRGHFPGTPIFPGVLLVEGAAQLAGTVAQSHPSIGALGELKLTGIRKMKILGSARPGDIILFDAQVTGRMGNLIQATVRGLVAGQCILDGEVTFSGLSAP
jgi:3-hydroxyacyl-[acyl-carrier-protein] dehydratase